MPTKLDTHRAKAAKATLVLTPLLSNFTLSSPSIRDRHTETAQVCAWSSAALLASEQFQLSNLPVFSNYPYALLPGIYPFTFDAL